MRSEIMRLVINWLLHLFDVLFIVKYLDCHKHEMQHSWVLHFTSGLLSDTLMHSKCYQKIMKNCTIAISHWMDLQTHVHNSRYSMLCFASNSNKISLLFLSNWTTVEFPNFQGQLWQKTISHWIWNFHVKIWRISKWMFCT